MRSKRVIADRGLCGTYTLPRQWRNLHNDFGGETDAL